MLIGPLGEPHLQGVGNRPVFRAGKTGRCKGFSSHSAELIRPSHLVPPFLWSCRPSQPTAHACSSRGPVVRCTPAMIGMLNPQLAKQGSGVVIMARWLLGRPGSPSLVVV